MEKNKTLGQHIADFLTKYFGTVGFFLINALFFLIWIIINLDLIPGVPVFDPYPYGLLTMIVSLEAIFLSIIVLISQNRASDIADLREELDLRINIRAEEEITVLVGMVDEIHDHLGLKPNKGKVYQGMMKKMDVKKIREELSVEMENRK